MRTAEWDSWIERARAVRIEDETDRRGIKLNGKPGKPARCGPCPRCGGDDRFAIHIGKQVFHCRICGGKGGGTIDLVMWLDGVDFIRAVETLAGDRREPVVRKPIERTRVLTAEQDDAEQHRKAAWLWSQRRPIAGTIAETYLREARGIACPLPPTLAFLPPSKPEHHPAMVAGFGIPDEIEPGVLAEPQHVPSNESEKIITDAVHLTLLRSDGSGKADVAKSKLFVARPLGRPIVLAPIGDSLSLAIVEGIEDGLSLRTAFEQLGVWAAGSGSSMPGLAETIPSYVEVVTIWAHPDVTGQNGARNLAELLDARGVEVFIEGLS
jgi:putative DNA primase/helicase